MITAARAAAAVLVAATALLATACTRTIEDARVVAAPDMGKAGVTASDCTSVDAPMTSIPDHGNDEPIMKIPQPDGWERVTMMDSELIRFTMRDTGMAVNGFGPTAVVTLESHPGVTDPKEVFDAQQSVLESGVGATDVHAADATLCKLPATIIDYTTPTIGPIAPHPAKVLCVVLQTDKRTFAMTVTLQTADPGNPTYQHDSETILTGFQMLPPTGA